MEETRRQEGRGDHYVLSTHTLLGVWLGVLREGHFLCLFYVPAIGIVCKRVHPFVLFSLPFLLRAKETQYE
jgi:hypothetical protein